MGSLLLLTMLSLVIASLLFVGSQAACLPCSSSKIVGGEEVKPGDVPWQVSVQNADWYVPDTDIQGWPFCGGVLIDEKYVLTAGHCVVGTTRELQVRLGDSHIFEEDETQQTIKVEHIYLHEKYDYFYLENDIALLKLKKAAVLNDYVKTIPLPKEKFSEPKGKCIVSGWGSLFEGGYCPEILNKVEVPIVSDKECNIAYPDGFFSSMLCAGYPEGGKDSCSGDSGGPLACKDDLGAYYVAGVVSFGTGCARPGTPGVYSQVSYFKDWILEKMKL